MKKSTQHRSMRCSRIVQWELGAIVISFMLGGCLSSPQQTPTQANISQPSDRPQDETPTRLSYGAITATVKKGTTTQSDLVTLFGGPNITTLDSDGMETWVYERTASETSTTSQVAVNSQVERFDVFFGLGLMGKGADASRSSEHTNVAHSIKTLTVIIKFNQDKTVQEYSARASYF
jgi:hypothetical protein